MDESENCQKNWWTNLLYASNLLRIREQCISLSWYLSNDMQINLNEADMNDFMDYIYEASYIRITPYLIGVVVGYFLLRTRNTMIVLKKKVAPVLWVVAFAMAIAVIFIPYNYQRGQYWTEFQCATYYSFGRIGWSLSLAWVVFAINNGYGGG
ncbi:hypothetical protein ANCDUO_22307 [Ancylostoma duodenale]|uniref:Uncharacterized protein n=1 Tax=Ancylostoma duodenale TaxID=51022 RepID=A0A0C2FLI4_9BILA|nr:hypothetical protein ANCDUO_22307 [Ancylostoma duodenale]